MPNCYFIAPQAPLVFRRGQPFGAADHAETLPFPLPAAVAGALRGAWGEQQAREHRARDYQREAAVFLALDVAGPLLARRALDGSQLTLYCPKPADAVYRDPQSFKLGRLQPLALGEREGTDLPPGLQLVQQPDATPQKPISGPAFWTLERLSRWLTHAAWFDDRFDGTKDGVGELPPDTRTHVQLEPERHAARTGSLFQTTGLDFGPRRQAADRGWNGSDPYSRKTDRHWRRWGLHEYGLFTYSEKIELPRTLHTVGGRSRLAWLEPFPAALWPRCPDSLAQALRQAPGVRIALATPAVFNNGWRPGWLKDCVDGRWQGTPPGLPDGSLTLELKAVALDRWQPASNWDARWVERKRGPTPIRRLAPAGTVYWFKIVRGDAAELAKLWLAPLSDDEQARQDGFGLAMPGIWNPETATRSEER